MTQAGSGRPGRLETAGRDEADGLEPTPAEATPAEAAEPAAEAAADAGTEA